MGFTDLVPPPVPARPGARGYSAMQPDAHGRIRGGPTGAADRRRHGRRRGAYLVLTGPGGAGPRARGDRRDQCVPRGRRGHRDQPLSDRRVRGPGRRSGLRRPRDRSDRSRRGRRGTGHGARRPDRCPRELRHDPGPVAARDGGSPVRRTRRGPSAPGARRRRRSRPPRRRPPRRGHRADGGHRGRRGRRAHRGRRRDRGGRTRRVRRGANSPGGDPRTARRPRPGGRRGQPADAAW